MSKKNGNQRKELGIHGPHNICNFSHLNILSTPCRCTPVVLCRLQLFLTLTTLFISILLTCGRPVGSPSNAMMSLDFRGNGNTQNSERA